MVSSERLSLAAEELVKAVALESSPTGSGMTNEAVLQELRNDLKHEVADFKESMETKINTTNVITNNITKSIKILTTKVSELEAKMNANAAMLSGVAIQNRKIQSLEWAITNVDVIYNESHPLRYFVEGKVDFYRIGNRCDSLIHSVLLAFRKNKSYYIPNSYMNAYSEHYDDDKARKFREEFSTLIHELTGIEPLIEARPEGREIKYVISYS